MVPLKAPQKPHNQQRPIQEPEESYSLLCPQRPPWDLTATHTPTESGRLLGGVSPFCRVPETACSPSEPGTLVGLPREQGGIRDSVPPTPTVPAGLDCGKLPKGQCHSEGWALAGGRRRPLETLTSHAVNSPQGVRLLGHRDSQDVPSRSLSPLNGHFLFPPSLLALTETCPCARVTCSPRLFTFVIPVPSGARASRASLPSPSPLWTSLGSQR